MLLTLLLLLLLNLGKGSNPGTEGWPLPPSNAVPSSPVKPPTFHPTVRSPLWWWWCRNFIKQFTKVVAAFCCEGLTGLPSASCLWKAANMPWSAVMSARRALCAWYHPTD